jgi:hypothetical protein
MQDKHFSSENIFFLYSNGPAHVDVPTLVAARLSSSDMALLATRRGLAAGM